MKKLLCLLLTVLTLAAELTACKGSGGEDISETSNSAISETSDIGTETQESHEPSSSAEESSTVSASSTSSATSSKSNVTTISKPPTTTLSKQQETQSTEPSAAPESPIDYYSVYSGNTVNYKLTVKSAAPTTKEGNATLNGSEFIPVSVSLEGLVSWISGGGTKYHVNFSGNGYVMKKGGTTFSSAQKDIDAFWSGDNVSLASVSGAIPVSSLVSGAVALTLRIAAKDSSGSLEIVEEINFIWNGNKLETQ